MKTQETSECSYKIMTLTDLESACPSKDATLNLNVKTDPVSGTFGFDNKLIKKEENMHDLDLNATEDISSRRIHTVKCYKHSKKSGNDPGPGVSSAGPTDQSDPMTVWKGLKQNNYMSARRGPPPVPAQKTRVRKKNNNDIDFRKKKIESVKKEQVDRFARVSEPSGLLNGLNPGIINYVRNRKQVHSIIGALVGSERSGSQGFVSNGGDMIENGVEELTDYAPFSGSSSYMGKNRIFEGVPLKYEVGSTDCITLASENASCLSVEGLENLKSVASLSFKAANVASQWLELLNQDIRSRLSALRSSRKRVQAVITTDLPDLMLREFSTDHLERNSNETKGSSEAHTARWSTMFGQMDNALSEEETHLENWLNQVKEMELHCESGIRTSLYGDSQESGPMEDDHRLEEGHINNSEKDLNVSAAAASIYSTCNFLLTMENCSYPD